MTKGTTKRNSPGSKTHFVVYAAALTALYFWSTPEITGNFTESQERGFYVAAVRLKQDDNKANHVAYSLAFVKAGKADLTAVSFLLPQDVIGRDAIDIPGADLHRVTVLERHPDWQLIEYRFGNSHDSISRYRAYKDRIEPVSYRVTMHMGIFIWAVVLLVPVYVVSAMINAIWKTVANRGK